jgi:hypothetical protein
MDGDQIMANLFDNDVVLEAFEGSVVFRDIPTGVNLLKVSYTGVDPNGTMTAPVGSIASGPAGTWVNTNGASAWSPIGTSVAASMDVFTGTGVLGTVVTAGGGAGDDLAYNAGLHDYYELTLSAGDTFAPSNPFTPLIIRAKTRITINGTIDVSALIQGGDGVPFIGSSEGSGGGGGGGGGNNNNPANSGLNGAGKTGFFYGNGSNGNGGAGASNGGNGSAGGTGTPGLSLDNFNPALLAYLRVYPGVTTTMLWGGLGGRTGSIGGDGRIGQTGGAAFGPGGQGAGVAGFGGGQIILIAPEIVFGPAAQLISNGDNGTAGANGGPGAPGAAGNDDGGGGGGGQSGGGGGGGGPILVYYQTLTNGGVTTSVLGGTGGAAGLGGAGGAPSGTGQAGGTGGVGGAGPAGSLGLVVFSQVIPT